MITGRLNRELSDGEKVEFKSSSGHVYTIARDGSTFYCTCPAWKFQHGVTPDMRTCKHIREMRGDAAENARLNGNSSGVAVSLPAATKTITHAKEVITIASGVVPIPLGVSVAVVSPAVTPVASLPTIPVIAPSIPDPASVASEAPIIVNHEEAVPGMEDKFTKGMTWTEKIDPTGYFMSEKLDGVRAWWVAKDRVLLSRNGIKFHVPDWFIKNFPPWDVDGEFWGGRGTFQATVGIVKRMNGGDAWKNIVYCVFEAPGIDNKPFEVRIVITKKWFEDNPTPHARVINNTSCKGIEHLNEILAAVVKEGGEGIMLRKGGTPYINGRTNLLLKVKAAVDSECIVIGHTDGTGKYKGMTGALRVRWVNGKEFKLGTGMDDDDRQHPPPIGSVITFKYHGLTNDGKPKEARYLRARDDVTWDEIVNSWREHASDNPELDG